MAISKKMVLLALTAFLLLVSAGCSQGNASEVKETAVMKVAAVDQLIAEEAAKNQTCDILLRDEYGNYSQVVKTIYKYDAIEAKAAADAERESGGLDFQIKC